MLEAGCSSLNSDCLKVMENVRHLHPSGMMWAATFARVSRSMPNVGSVSYSIIILEPDFENLLPSWFGANRLISEFILQLGFVGDAPPEAGEVEEWTRLVRLLRLHEILEIERFAV